ncbi:hypothetical protein ACFGVR_10405 [Mucilaginibacter sp. AW1-3]
MYNQTIIANNQVIIKKQWQRPELVFIDGADIQLRPKAGKAAKEMYTPTHALSYHS